MKKTLILAMLVIAGATVTTTTAGNKDKKKKGAKTTALKPVVLSTGIDSLCYAMGLAQSMSVKSYVADQLKVDTTYMDAFIEGFMDAANRELTGEEAARFAGNSIGLQVAKTMIPTMEDDIKSADENLVFDRNAFISAFVSGINGNNALMTKEQAQKVSREKMAQLKDRANEKTKKAGEDFLAENAKKEGVVVLPSGLQYRVITEGTGMIPKEDDKVRVTYEGRLIDGTVFDASARHDEKGVVFKPNQVIKGWTEALTMMPVGSKWQLFIPQNLAYGQRGAGKDIKPYSALIFEVEILGLENN
ncbi:MAG: FKBP-type peptidyl-prolyl cis-trans isomerase [Prevotella sp.]|uniref:FKBP-type peptidyl-prolyl cis-trans isomerase n=1 Tax=Prevotella sp. TaxID=59823 RepID=UPI002A31B5AE|nr:FKBP-type peptidyl-prolyl cis-trans isomerase [Prevotella sp.]MDD7318398.1 FKBP-type peptidyl-prolyl cis-trans isomerase [Prevotellaceae bacterium]MDY4020251.1 FKBP-type peptidyl-prolyl cis-trans isomerase [Prevotella sp.]